VALGIKAGRPTETDGTLLRSCARATHSSQITLGGLVIIMPTRPTVGP